MNPKYFNNQKPKPVASESPVPTVVSLPGPPLAKIFIVRDVKDLEKEKNAKEEDNANDGDNTEDEN